MENNIMGLVGAFIGIAIMLAIGVQILGNAIQDCTDLPGFNVQNSTGDADGSATDGTLDVSTGWALSCENTNTQSQNAYTLLIVILVVVAAVAILSVVRLL